MKGGFSLIFANHDKIIIKYNLILFSDPYDGTAGHSMSDLDSASLLYSSRTLVKVSICYVILSNFVIDHPIYRISF